MYLNLYAKETHQHVMVLYKMSNYHSFFFFTADTFNIHGFRMKNFNMSTAMNG